MIAAGAQQMDRGIHRGLVNRIKKSTQRQRPTNMSTALDCKMICRRKIKEKRLNFKRKRATCLDLIFNLKLI
jgi:hypothetical protein